MCVKVEPILTLTATSLVTSPSSTMSSSHLQRWESVHAISCVRLVVSTVNRAIKAPVTQTLRPRYDQSSSQIAEDRR